MAVRGGMFMSLCFLASLFRSELRLMSRVVRPAFEASWSSIRAFATSAQHRRKRSLSGAMSGFFLVGTAVTVMVAVAMMNEVMGTDFAI